MAGGTFLPGVKGGDIRYERRQAKLAQSLSTLPRLTMSGVVIDSLRGWIEGRLAELVGINDEVLLDFVMNTLEEKQTIEAGELRVLLIPFMGEEHSDTFVKELWDWVGKAHKDGGIPAEFEVEYKARLKAEKELQDRKERQKEDERNRSRPIKRPHSPVRRSHSPVRRSRSPARRRYYNSPSPRRRRRSTPSISPPRAPPRVKEPVTPPGSPASSSYESTSEEDELTIQLKERALRLMNKE